jgi:hypothetical protein
LREFIKIQKILILFIVFLVSSCGQNKEEEIDDAIDRAEVLLSVGSCDEALFTIKSVGTHNKNARYLRVLASAYACGVGYTETTLFGTDLAKLGTPTALGAFTRFTNVDNMSTFDDEDYDNMWIAINTLLYAGGFANTKEPTASRRSEFFTSEEAGNINAQLMYMLMNQLGRYLRFYGNGDSAGAKGGGTGSNNCLINYSNVVLDLAASDLDTYLTGGGITGVCITQNDGSDDLGLQTALNPTRICEGVVLLNTFRDVFPAVVAAAGFTDLNGLNDIETALSTADIAILAAKSGITDLVNDTLSQTNCVSENTASTDNLEVFFSYYFEVLYP